MVNAHNHIICDQTNTILEDGVTLYPGYIEVKDGQVYRFYSDDPNNIMDTHRPDFPSPDHFKRWIEQDKGLRNRVEFKRSEGPVTAPENTPDGHYIDMDAMFRASLTNRAMLDVKAQQVAGLPEGVGICETCGTRTDSELHIQHTAVETAPLVNTPETDAILPQTAAQVVTEQAAAEIAATPIDPVVAEVAPVTEIVTPDEVKVTEQTVDVSPVTPEVTPPAVDTTLCDYCGHPLDSEKHANINHPVSTAMRPTPLADHTASPEAFSENTPEASAAAAVATADVTITPTEVPAPESVPVETPIGEVPAMTTTDGPDSPVQPAQSGMPTIEGVEVVNQTWGKPADENK